jgi:hypothetical protein
MTPARGAANLRGMSDLSLVGGPMHGRVVDAPHSGGLLELEGNRYIVRRSRARVRDARRDIGIFLPLYARLLEAHRGHRAVPPPELL